MIVYVVAIRRISPQTSTTTNTTSTAGVTQTASTLPFAARVTRPAITPATIATTSPRI